jgi:hypothetical protein
MPDIDGAMLVWHCPTYPSFCDLFSLFNQHEKFVTFSDCTVIAEVKQKLTEVATTTSCCCMNNWNSEKIIDFLTQPSIFLISQDR